ncbi:sulfite exporter TauE/SafE family protein [Avrilella dinanensis]|uniref:sulfite exporter TauE/SafE family protein n=1 Tax=Avrilella dinanensis TaxID=2008672 RepID=UPI0024094E0B|nr:sulfite exporter TauE/SafE family protein [Avrilella dinanensis]
MLSAFLFGLLSSLHCVGMCGPIAMMLPVSRTSEVKRASQIIIYHLGRIFTYGLLGGLFGWLGRGLFIAGLQQKLSVILGILMIVYVLIPKNKFNRIYFLQPLYRLVNKAKKLMGLQFKKNNSSSFFVIGLLNGFLPCAMVYVALFGATATQTPIDGMMYMMLFGLGTVPMMSAVVYVTNAISVRMREKILKAVPVFVIILGTLFVIRGMGLDIPFLSPGTLKLFVTTGADCY